MSKVSIVVYGIALHSSRELHKPNRKLNTSLIELLSFLFVSLLPNWFCTLTGNFAGDVKGTLLFCQSENEFALRVSGDAIVQELIGAYVFFSLSQLEFHILASPEILFLFPLCSLLRTTNIKLNNSNNNSSNFNNNNNNRHHCHYFNEELNIVDTP